MPLQSADGTAKEAMGTDGKAAADFNVDEVIAMFKWKQEEDRRMVRVSAVSLLFFNTDRKSCSRARACSLTPRKSK